MIKFENPSVLEVSSARLDKDFVNLEGAIVYKESSYKNANLDPLESNPVFTVNVAKGTGNWKEDWWFDTQTISYYSGIAMDRVLFELKDGVDEVYKCIAAICNKYRKIPVELFLNYLIDIYSRTGVEFDVSFPTGKEQYEVMFRKEEELDDAEIDTKLYVSDTRGHLLVTSLSIPDGTITELARLILLPEYNKFKYYNLQILILAHGMVVNSVIKALKESSEYSGDTMVISNFPTEYLTEESLNYCQKLAKNKIGINLRDTKYLELDYRMTGPMAGGKPKTLFTSLDEVMGYLNVIGSSKEDIKDSFVLKITNAPDYAKRVINNEAKRINELKGRQFITVIE